MKTNKNPHLGMDETELANYFGITASHRATPKKKEPAVTEKSEEDEGWGLSEAEIAEWSKKLKKAGTKKDKAKQATKEHSRVHAHA